MLQLHISFRRESMRSVQEINFVNPLDHAFQCRVLRHPGYLSTEEESNLLKYMQQVARPALLVDPDTSLGESSGRAVLVDVTHEKADILYANYKCQVLLYRRHLAGPAQCPNSEQTLEKVSVSGKSCSDSRVMGRTPWVYETVTPVLEVVQKVQQWCIS